LKEFTHIIKSEKSESPQILTKNLSKK
jgi:hypothetical protein